MSSISLSKPQRMTAAAHRREASARQCDPTSTVANGVQDRPVTGNGTISPSLFWKVIICLAVTSLVGNAIGMTEFGASWFTAYWDTLAYWCNSGYCR